MMMQWLFVLCGFLSLSRAQDTYPATYSGSGSSFPGSGSAALCPGQFGCPNGLCLPFEQVCDGNADCPWAEDELVCVERGNCRPDQFRCPMGKQECVSLAVVCDGIQDCLGGTEENNCPPPPPGSRCLSGQFECPLSPFCIPLAKRCDGSSDCLYTEDEQMCVPPVVTELPDATESVQEGANVTLTCVAEGEPPPFVTWMKDLQPLPVDPRYTVQADGGVGTLTIRDARLLDAAEYTCQVVSTLHGSSLAQRSTRLIVEDTTPFTCEDHRDQQHQEGSYYHNVVSFTSGPATQAAADIVFVVDESGSMVMEHDWIRDEVFRLDSQLQGRGVGAGENENLFALVGFGRNDPVAIAGVVLSQLATPADFVTASLDLRLSGLVEDGYSGMDFAVGNIALRPETAKMMILVTDEDRGIIRKDLSRDIIDQRLSEAGFVLNVVVNQGFLADPTNNNSHALGLNGNETAYVFDPNSPNLFTTEEGGVPNFGNFFSFGNTYRDYVELAFGLGGAAWDLNQFREEGVFAEAFTSAFTEVKVEEITSVFRLCFSCLCTPPEPQCVVAENVTIDSCFGTPAILSVAVTPSSILAPPGSTITFNCLTHVTTSPSLLEFTWRYPSQPGGNVIVDGDTLTVNIVSEESAGMYTCTVTDSNSGQMASANGTLDIDDRCILGDGTVLLLDENRVVLTLPPNNITRAADVILIVDESGSMFMEHQWIGEMTVALDGALILENIGVDPRNRFGVVGFGADCVEDFILGRVIMNSAGEVFSLASGVSEFTAGLGTNGRREDGYSGIKTAFDGYEFRDVAKQFILITDEDRDVVQENLTRDGIRELLEEAGIVLNAAVSEEFEGSGLRALGIDSGMNAYVYDPSADSLFRIVRGSGMPVTDSGHGSTDFDYTQLALWLGGAGWNLSMLREGGTVAKAFTNAFVHAKVVEIRSQMEVCLNCTCTLGGALCEALPAANFSECLRRTIIPPPSESPLTLTLNHESVRILPQQQLTLSCQANNTARLAWTFNGGLLPNNTNVDTIGTNRSELVIFSPGDGNTGMYACLANTPSEAFKQIAVVMVEFYDPSQDLMLELHPLDITVTQGEDITFTCTTNEPAIYEWKFEGGDLPSNAFQDDKMRESSLTIFSANASKNMGAYTCIAFNPDTNVTNEDTTYLDVASVPFQLGIEGPSLVQLMPGMDHYIECETNENASRIYWKFNGQRIPVQGMSGSGALQVSSGMLDGSGTILPTSLGNVFSVDVSGMRSRLVIEMTTGENSGVYQCIGVAESGVKAMASVEVVVGLTPSSTSSTPTATVVPTASPTPPPPYMVSVAPSTLELAEDENGTITCEANHPASSFVWRLDFQELPDNVVISRVDPQRSELTIVNMIQDNTGHYQCTVTSALTNESSTAFSTIIFMEILSISVGPDCSATVNEMDRIEFTCSLACGCSGTELTWTTQDGSPLPPSAMVSHSGSRRTTFLLFDSVPRSAAGVYVCQAVHSQLGTVRQQVRLDVIPSGNLTTEPSTSIQSVPTPTPTPIIPGHHNIIITPDTITRKEGELAVFTCTTNSPATSFIWGFNFGQVPGNAEPNMVSDTVSQLQIRNVVQDNAGTYTCTAEFVDNSTDTDLAILIFDEALRIKITQGGNVVATQGDRVELECTLDCSCDGMPVLNWMREGGNSLPSSAIVTRTGSMRTVTLTFETVSVDVGGVYQCNAVRGGETVIELVTLQVV